LPLASFLQWGERLGSGMTSRKIEGIEHGIEKATAGAFVQVRDD